jgi:hypothetical protein
MAGTEQPFFVFLIVHEASQMGADPGKSDIPLVRPVDDDPGSIVEDDVLCISGGDIFLAEDKFFCPSLTGRGRKKFEKRVQEGGEGRQTQKGERFLQECASVRHGGCEVVERPSAGKIYYNRGIPVCQMPKKSDTIDEIFSHAHA